MTTQKRDKRFNITNYAAKLADVAGPMVNRSSLRVSVGRHEFVLETFTYSGLSANIHLLVAWDDDFMSVRRITRDELDNLENAAGVLDWSPDPWGDANAIEEMARHWLGVDSVSIRWDEGDWVLHDTRARHDEY